MSTKELERENIALKKEIKVLRECVVLLCKMGLSVLNVYELTDERLNRLHDLLEKVGIL